MSSSSQKLAKSPVRPCTSAWFQNGKAKKSMFKAPSLVLVYADWCGYCTKFTPDYIHLQAQLGALDFYAMNADENKLYLQQYGKTMGVRGYPTLLKIVDGDIIPYESDDRTMPSLVAFACKGGLC